MNRLIVAFSSDTAAHRICAWLAQSGFPARTVCRTGAEVVRAVRYMGGGSVICAARLPDYTADRLYDDLDGQADLLVIGKPEQLSDCENPAIRRLPLPVNRYQLAEAAEALTQAQQARAPAEPSQQDQEIIPARQGAAAIRPQHGRARGAPLFAAPQHGSAPQNGGYRAADHRSA